MTERKSDEALLEMLYQRDVLGWSSARIGRAMGRTRGSVVGALHRVNKATDAVACRCRRRANRNGGMPARWWASDG